MGVAFDTKGGPLLFVCGRFTTWQDNLRAIAKTMEALRAVKRWGATQSDEQYTGFRALPAATPMLVFARQRSARCLEISGHQR